jgi:dolichyl-phosphate-mannose--protein O-mannosyl transferase
MTLSLAIAYCFERWADSPVARGVFLVATLALFAYFFPVLAALRIPSESFRNWMWFSSWI